jgi:anti-anti-sigma factor
MRGNRALVSSPNPDLELTEVDGRPTVKGDVDLRSAARIQEWLGTYDGQRLEVDLSGVTFFDSTGLRAFLKARSEHSGLRIVAPSRAVLHVLEVTSTVEYLMGD